MDVDLSEYIEVVEESCASNVNRLLKDGWELISVVQYEAPDWDEPQGAMYVLGKKD